MTTPILRRLACGLLVALALAGCDVASNAPKPAPTAAAQPDAAATSQPAPGAATAYPAPAPGDTGPATAYPAPAPATAYPAPTTSP